MRKCTFSPSHLLTFAAAAAGVTERNFAEGPNRAHHFIYASAPAAGLETVLLTWHRIQQRVAGAELHVYYGFWPRLQGG